MNLYTKIVQNRCGMAYVVVYLKKKYLITKIQLLNIMQFLMQLLIIKELQILLKIWSLILQNEDKLQKKREATLTMKLTIMLLFATSGSV